MNKNNAFDDKKMSENIVFEYIERVNDKRNDFLTCKRAMKWKQWIVYNSVHVNILLCVL